MEPQSLFNVFVAAGLAALGWFARTLWDAIKDVRDELQDHRVKIAEDYTPKDDFKEAVTKLSEEMKDGFNRLFDRLDAKADK